MEVNEEIIQQYLKSVKKWFYMSDISFPVPHNYSNIDLLAYDPFNDKYYDFEVKYRSAFTISLKNIENDKELSGFVDQFTRIERQEAIRQIIGAGAIEKVFVTTHQLFGKSTEKRRKIEDAFKNQLNHRGFSCEIWYFDDIISEIYKQTELAGRYNTELMQTMRLIKTYMEK